jgi:integrase
MARWNQTDDNRCAPLAEWPAIDQAAWQAALQPAGLFNDGGVAAGWKPQGQTMVINGYGRWLTWLIRTGQLNPDEPPSTRVTRERVAAYAEALAASGNAAMTVQSRIHQLARAMRALAPEGGWSWISRAADRLRAEAVPVREKRSRMQSSDALADLGIHLMGIAARTDDHFAIPRAALYRDGLMIATLALRPFRARNFASITLGEHLILQHDQWRFDFQDTKTSRIEAPFPEDLVPYLETYLEVHRPILLTGKPIPGVIRAPTQALWIAKGGKQMGAAAISYEIKKHTGDAFGKDLNPHLFRDCETTTVAIEAPENIHDVPTLLGHASMRTSEKHYNQAQTLQAGRLYQATIKQLRRRKPGPVI